MKLLLLHGAAINSSRNYLLEIKKKFDSENVVVFEKGADPKNILDTLVATPLFNENKLVLIENPPEDFVLDSTLITNNSSLIIWFDHEIAVSKPIITWTKRNGGEILFFPESKEVSVFAFLDSLAAGNKKAFLELNKLKNTNFDVFYVITMIFYLLRSLVATPKNAPQFVRSKLQKQRARFEMEDLKKLYGAILEIEFKLKSGLSEKDQAEFLLLNRFIEFV